MSNNINEQDKYATQEFRVAKPANKKNGKGNKKTTSRRKSKNNKKKSNFKKIIKCCAVIIGIIIIIGAGVAAGLFLGLFGDDLSFSTDVLIGENSTMYDSEENELGVLSGDENRKLIKTSEMSEYLPKAFVSIEDERFYKHNGVDVKRTLGATATYILNRGDSSYGGSTITQQLIKNITKENQKSPIRKIKEMASAYQLERMKSKDEILELYLNIIPLGGGGKNIHGVEMASQFYFSKPAKDLDIAESAFLAGVTHSPNTYNPFKENPNTERIKTRTKTVLGKMKELGKIDEEQYKTAVEKVESGLPFEEGKVSTASYSYHTEAAINQIVKDLMEEKNCSEDAAKLILYGSGLKIYTTQNTSIQTRLEEEYAKKQYIIPSANKEKKAAGVTSQSAMVVIDHKTGYVVGTVGGLGEKTSFGLNRATQSKRQTGSSMKPIAVVAPGLEKGVLTAGTVYADVPTTFGKYNPKNYNNYKGPITIRSAIETSQNIVPLKAMVDIGPENAIKFLKEMGITSLDDKKDASLSLALGGLTNGIKPLEMAAAYATIANDGEYITPTFYTKVVDSKGKVILEPKQEKRRVMTEENAYIEKSILTQPVVGSGGTAKYCTISGMEVAAKTGTTNDDYDRWLCGFTPYYTAATWFGYDEQEEVRYGNGNPAGRIWAAVMKDIHKGLKSEKFEKPKNIVSATICKESGLLAGDKCTNTYSEVFNKGTTPSKKCDKHVSVRICNESGKVATEFCPSVSTKIFVTKPDTEEKGKWKSDYQGKYGIVTEKCSIHTSKKEETPANSTTGGNTTEGGNTTGGNTTKPSTGGNTTKPSTGGNSTGGNSTKPSTGGNSTGEDKPKPPTNSTAD